MCGLDLAVHGNAHPRPTATVASEEHADTVAHSQGLARPHAVHLPHLALGPRGQRRTQELHSLLCMCGRRLAGLRRVSGRKRCRIRIGKSARAANQRLRCAAHEPTVKVMLRVRSDLLATLDAQAHVQATSTFRCQAGLVHLDLVVGGPLSWCAEAPAGTICDREALVATDHHARGRKETSARGHTHVGRELHVRALGHPVPLPEVENTGSEPFPLLCGSALDAVDTGNYLPALRAQVLVVLAHLAQQCAEVLTLLEGPAAAPLQAVVVIHQQPEVVSDNLHTLASELLVTPEVRIRLDTDIHFPLHVPLQLLDVLVAFVDLVREMCLVDGPLVVNPVDTLDCSCNLLLQPGSCFGELLQLPDVDAGHLLHHRTDVLLHLVPVAAQGLDGRHDLRCDLPLHLADGGHDLALRFLELLVRALLLSLELRLEHGYELGVLPLPFLQRPEFDELVVLPKLNDAILLTSRVEGALKVLLFLDLPMLVVEVIGTLGDAQLLLRLVGERSEVLDEASGVCSALSSRDLLVLIGQDERSHY
mmetsp:Transcript_1860/g.3858  ORF Transcript_1860/g.3858 Transcript_1860/m.3858 type:complete len:534 (-) Transcript_1860:133-1734(-)